MEKASSTSILIAEWQLSNILTPDRQGVSTFKAPALSVLAHAHTVGFGFLNMLQKYRSSCAELAQFVELALMPLNFEGQARRFLGMS